MPEGERFTGQTDEIGSLAELDDLICSAATTLAGIAEALALRCESDPDDLLEMLANAANAESRILRQHRRRT